jgi:DNA-directed RNA polymerase specialized sigma24 family protein
VTAASADEKVSQGEVQSRLFWQHRAPQTSRQPRVSERYEELRPPMFSIASRMPGSASEAEDIVQEVFLRLHREAGKGTAIESPKAYLSAVTTDDAAAGESHRQPR